MNIILIALLTCTLLAAQTRDNLKRRFGDSVSETFSVRPGILVTATYGNSGRTIERLIAPQTTGHQISNPGRHEQGNGRSNP